MQIEMSTATRSWIRAVGGVLAVLLAIFSAITYAVSLVLGPVLFFFTPEGLGAASRTIQGIPIDLFMAFTFSIPLPLSVGTLFLAVWVVFVASLVLAWFSRNTFPRTIRDALTKPVSTAKANFLFLMPIVTSALLYATILIQQFQETQGVETGSLNFPPQTSPYIILINLIFAVLREEFAFRITSIGIPVGLFLIMRYRSDERISGFLSRLKLLLLAMFSPEHAKIKLGTKNVSANGFLRGISPLEWVLILLTSAVFGSAHFLLGGGWQPGKITTAFLAGFVIGVMYVAYGAYAGVLLHWFFNYYFEVLDRAGATYSGFFQILPNLAELVNLLAGQIVLVVFLLYSAFKLGGYLASKAAGWPAKSDKSA